MTLPNGVRIASQASSDPAASLGLYVDSGSIYETPSTSGCTHLLESMAFKSTANRSHLRAVREVEAIGGEVTASASRDQMDYTYDALKTYVPQMVELLVDSVINPVFLDWDVKEQLEKVKQEVQQLNNNPEGLLLEALHSVGYTGALANPLSAPEDAVDRLNGDLLEKFVAENYTAPHIVLSIAEPLLSDLPVVPHHIKPKSVYTGGEFRCQAETPTTDIAIAFEIPGGWLAVKESMQSTVLQVLHFDLVIPDCTLLLFLNHLEALRGSESQISPFIQSALIIFLLLLFFRCSSIPFFICSMTRLKLALVIFLQFLMGGGCPISFGGPGKGMCSRLYRRVLNKHTELQSFTSFNALYDRTGLFGIHASVVVKVVELNRAKEAAKSAILMNLESRRIASEDIGRLILTHGERF
ncbi:hypothetical protein MKW98_010755 [Papaver atlanticum]|uniref:Mitochondrial-processing peptidase subunit alpha n=1 Tax=Papaver atlanticum TaxID=357466 RepID=A0AAD4XHV2_9MAGN|nr:hypothetical protein MKW98_010755 [Papaver atlanticum]